MPDYAVLISPDGVALTDSDGQAVTDACPVCCSRFFSATPCVVAGIGGGNQNEPCNRPPFAVVYVRSDVLIGAGAGAESIGALVRRYADLAGGGPIGGGDGSNRRFEVGFVWAGQCYTISGTQTFDLPVGLPAGGSTDLDPYTSDVIVPPVRLPAVSASVIAAGDVGPFCGGCLSGIRYCAAYPCSNQPGEVAGRRAWVCAAVVGSTGNVFDVGGVCYCVSCAESVDLVELIALGERGRVLDPNRTFNNCTDCWRFYNQLDGETAPCPDGSSCRIERPCSCTFDGSAQVFGYNTQGQFSYLFDYRVLPSGVIEQRGTRWNSNASFNGPPDEVGEWSAVGGLGEVLPACQAFGPTTEDGQYREAPSGAGVIQGSSITIGTPPGLGGEGYWGTRTFQSSCTGWTYGWQSRNDGPGPFAGDVVTSQGSVSQNCTCANSVDVSVCTRPNSGAVTATPGDAALPVDPLADGP